MLGGKKRFGPAHRTGAARWSHTGSMSTLMPSISTSIELCPNQVTRRPLAGGVSYMDASVWKGPGCLFGFFSTTSCAHIEPQHLEHHAGSAHLGGDGILEDLPCLPGSPQHRHFASEYSGTTRRSPPVIWFGCSIASRPSIVGEISRRLPPSRTPIPRPSPVTRRRGTGLVVWAVCGPPVAGSISISALP